MPEVGRLLNIEKTLTTPLHPQSDGQVERFNKTLVEILRGKSREDQTEWDAHLSGCMIGLLSVHESTGETPNLLILAREVEVPPDVLTKPPSDSTPPQTDTLPLLTLSILVSWSLSHDQ